VLPRGQASTQVLSLGFRDKIGEQAVQDCLQALQKYPVALNSKPAWQLGAQKLRSSWNKLSPEHVRQSVADVPHVLQGDVHGVHPKVVSPGTAGVLAVG